MPGFFAPPRSALSGAGCCRPGSTRCAGAGERRCMDMRVGVLLRKSDWVGYMMPERAFPANGPMVSCAPREGRIGRSRVRRRRFTESQGARSSAVEHYVDMVGVTGSIPVAPTMKMRQIAQSLCACHRPRDRFATGLLAATPQTARPLSPALRASAHPWPDPSARAWGGGLLVVSAQGLHCGALAFSIDGMSTLASRVYWTAFTVSEARKETRLPFWPLERVRGIQNRRIAGIIDHAYRYVPFYRRAMIDAGLEPGDIRTADDLALLPVVTREELLATPGDFRASNFAAERCLRIESSGTSGRAKPIYHDARRTVPGAGPRSPATPGVASSSSAAMAAIGRWPFPGHRGCTARSVTFSRPIRFGCRASS